MLGLTPNIRRVIAAMTGLVLVAAAWFNTSLIQDRWMQARERLTGVPATPRPADVESRAAAATMRTSTVASTNETSPLVELKRSPAADTGREPTEQLRRLPTPTPSRHLDPDPPAIAHADAIQVPLVNQRRAAEQSSAKPAAARPVRLPAPFLTAQAPDAAKPAVPPEANERAPEVPSVPPITAAGPTPTDPTEDSSGPTDRLPPSVVAIAGEPESAGTDNATVSSSAASSSDESSRKETETETETVPPAPAVAPNQPAAEQRENVTDTLSDDRITWETPPLPETKPGETSKPTGPGQSQYDDLPAGPSAATTPPDRLFPAPEFAPSPGAATRTWHLTMQQARRYSLENNKDVHILRQDPELAATTIQSEEAVFDPTFVMSARGGQLNRQVSSLIQSFGGNFGSQRTDIFSGDDLDSIGLTQRLKTGGLLSAGWLTDYQALDPLGAFVIKNPAWLSQLSVRLEQPLLRGAGREVNEAPILIAVTQHTQAEAEVKAAVNATMLSVETAYWNAVGAHHETKILAEIVKTSHDLWVREQEMLRVGKGSIPNVSQSEEQYHDFRVQQVEAQLRFDEAVRELLRIMGYPTNAEVSLALATQPLGLEFEPNWELAKFRVQQRPELLAQRAAVDAAEIAVRQSTNGLRPDLALRLGYATTGLETGLDDALETMSRNQFNDWTMGLVYRQPIGRQADSAAARAALVSLRREQLAFDQLQHNITHELRSALQRVITNREIAQLQTKRRLSAVSQFEASQELYESGRVQLLDQLQAQQIASEARIEELRATILFNIAVATWQFAQGDFEDCYRVVTPTSAASGEPTLPKAPPASQPPKTPQDDLPAPNSDKPEEQEEGVSTALRLAPPTR